MADDTHNRKLATIVALDVAGYSARTERDEAASTAEVAALHGTIEAIAARHGGRIFNTAGDGFMLEFASSLAAVEAAFELAETCEPKVRVGVHVGDVVPQPNGDLLGHGVNVAARLMAQAVPGSTLISADVKRMMRGPLVQSLRPKGTVKLAKMSEAIEVFAFTPEAHLRQGLHARLTNLWARRPPLRSKQGAIAGATVLLVALAFAAWRFMATTPEHSTQADIADAVAEASVAVLPFENLSADKDNAFFAAGIQDEILTRLAKIGSLKVISRTSTAHMSSRPENLPEIAKQLGVANILEGSVQRQGDAVRVNVQLIKASTDGHLWAEIYDRKLDNIFAVQSEIAIAIAEALSAKVTGEEKQEIALKPTNNAAAYDTYLRGSAFFRKADYVDAEPVLQTAVKLDPNFALAWALLAKNHARQFQTGDRSPTRSTAARAALDAALRLQPDLPEVLLAQAYHQYWVERDFPGARQRFEQVYAKWPNNSDAVAALGYIARRQGRWDEAKAYLKQAAALDPLSLEIRTSEVETLIEIRDFAAAQTRADEALNIWPDSPRLIGISAELYQAHGRLDQADALLKGMRLVPGDGWSTDAIYNQAVYRRHYTDAIGAIQTLLAQSEAAEALDVTRRSQLNLYLGELRRLAGDAAGAKADYIRVRDDALSELQRQKGNYFLVGNLAFAYCGLGEREQSLKYADQAVELLPAEKDALDGPGLELTRARIWARLGDRERAIPEIARLLKVRGLLPSLTPANLRLDPDFDKLRGDPRFEALLKDDATPK